MFILCQFESPVMIVWSQTVLAVGSKNSYWNIEHKSWDELSPLVLQSRAMAAELGCWQILWCQQSKTVWHATFATFVMPQEFFYFLPIHLTRGVCIFTSSLMYAVGKLSFIYVVMPCWCDSSSYWPSKLHIISSLKQKGNDSIIKVDKVKMNTFSLLNK